VNGYGLSSGNKKGTPQGVPDILIRCLRDNAYLTLAKMITRVYRASDSIKARPRMSAV
jgi:hypothetical protein